MHKLGISLIVCLVIGPAHASSVRVNSSEESIIYTQGNPDPSITLQLENLLAAEMPEILIWQVGLNVVPTGSAVGSVGITNLEEPVDYLFSGSSSPLSFPSLPQPAPITTVDISDALIFAPNGVPLTVNDPQNIAKLTFSVSNNAAGTFDIVLAPFNGSPSNSSSWSPTLVFNPADALEFSNAMTGSSMESRVVASIHILPVPEPSTIAIVFCVAITGSLLRNRKHLIASL